MVVNNGKNYYDYEKTFSKRVSSIGCIRTAGINSCFEFKEFVKGLLFCYKRNKYFISTFLFIILIDIDKEKEIDIILA